MGGLGRIVSHTRDTTKTAMKEGKMISMRKKIGYGLGDMGLSISYFTVGFFFIYYLTDIVKLQPYLAGLAYFIGQAWDSINDPLIGAISDRTRSRHGRKRVYLLYGVLPFALSFILLWMVPLEGSQALKFGFATVAMLVYVSLYSLIAVPYTALVPVMTNDYDERTQIIGIRTILSTLGTILGGGAAMLVSSFDSELTGLRVMALAFALWLVVTVFAAARSTRELEPPASRANLRPAYSWRRYLGLLRDRNVSILMVFKFLGAVATGSLVAALPYFSKYILGDEGRSTIGLALYILVAAACVPLWERLSRRYDKRRLLLWAMVVLVGLLLAIGLLVTAELVPAFYAGCALMGTVMSAYTLIAYSFPPDLVDYYEVQAGERHESILFGFWHTTHQLGVATAGLLLGLFLQVFGYNGANATQAPAAVLAIRLSLALVPGLFMLLAVIVLQRYGITRSAYLQIRATIDQRKLAQPEGEPAGV
jgi:glycoside/pentoside/hexuronide:cation symporter, GPH family